MNFIGIIFQGIDIGGWDEQSKTIVAQARHLPLHPESPNLIKVHD